jgi:hemolysin activation/secretion protein
MIGSKSALTCACLAALAAAAAEAQIVVDKVQPNRLDTERSANLPPAKPPVKTPKPTTSVAGAPAKGVKVAGVRLEGSSLPKEAAEKAMRPFIGKPLNAKVLQGLADAYSAAYAHSHIALYSILIPEQDFAGGQVRIVAIENYIDEVILAGDKPEKASLTRSYAAAMARERPLTREVLQRNLLLMNDIPGAKTTPRVIAGDRPDSVKLVLNTKREPVETVLTVDTRGASRLGRVQLQGDVYFNGWGYEGNQTRLTAASSVDFKRFLSAAVAHSTTFGPNGVTVTGSLGYFRTRPDDTPIEGQGYTAGLQGSYPLIRSVNANLSIAGGIDGLDSKNAFVGQTISSDRTRVVRAAVSGDYRRGKTAAAANASISQGLNGLGARITNPAYAAKNFTKVNAQVAASRQLNQKWRVQSSAAVQLSSDRLPASEQFVLGGERFGRAFENGAATGDAGVAGALELARSVGKQSTQRGQEVYAFVDSGKLWIKERPGFAGDKPVLSSAGAGARVSVARKTLLGLEVAKAIEGGHGDGWRMSLSLGSKF